MRIAMTLLVAALAVGAGCKKKENAASEGSGSSMAGSGSSMAMGSGSGSAMMAGSGSGSGSAMMAGSGSGSGSAAMAGSGSGADATMAHHAGNCPSTVLGSTTKAELKGKEVIVTVTASDKDAIKAIQTRTEEMLKARLGKKEPGDAHDQRGTHGQTIGLCPMHIPEGATAKAKNEKDGVAVTITPKDKAAELKTEIDGRIAKAADWVKANIKPGDDKNMGAVGGGKANEGMNHSGSGDGKGMDRKNDGKGGGGGTGGGGGKGTGGGSGAKK